MKPLVSKVQGGGIWLVPCRELTSLKRYDWLELRETELVKDLEENGLTWPLVVWAATPLEWAQRLEARREPVVARPVLVASSLILVVHRGSQRLEYARSNNYSHVSVAIRSSWEDCQAYWEWLQKTEAENA